MRLNYYGSGDWKDDPRETAPEAPRTEPFGELPGPAAEDQREREAEELPPLPVRHTPSAWAKAPRQKPPRPKRPRDRRSGTGPRRFGLIFALLLLWRAPE